MENVEVGQNYCLILGPQFFAGRVKNITEETVMLENASLLWDTTSYPKMDCEDHLETVQRFEYLGRAPLRAAHVTMAFPWRGGLPEQHNSGENRERWLSEEDFKELQAQFTEFSKGLQRVYEHTGNDSFNVKSTLDMRGLVIDTDKQKIRVNRTGDDEFYALVSYVDKPGSRAVQFRQKTLDTLTKKLQQIAHCDTADEALQLLK